MASALHLLLFFFFFSSAAVSCIDDQTTDFSASDLRASDVPAKEITLTFTGEFLKPATDASSVQFVPSNVKFSAYEEPKTVSLEKLAEKTNG
ncbi:hypothetical protein [Crucian carp herpesvirus]|uniref:ORF119 n=1 Tax=Cyprinid herpesvirus 2 TaxID=317878 RepID=K7PCQ3_CYHV2|nr:protein ORF119 [Cyprinid herpesvirus 2]APB92961.1 hypothetical protein [Crucian carp herpesvirus]AFJ20605.1 protein ORF119 [Cyprinid herpesvirus 2]AMB21685.1 ORF119 [Cyprinid herpesvirus 2]QAU54838.1 protein ORF119 [Cyprinid herpesvirus 2]QIM55289.1 hypothetical protein [Cyprinid herpesvirus 2]